MLLSRHPYWQRAVRPQEGGHRKVGRTWSFGELAHSKPRKWAATVALHRDLPWERRSNAPQSIKQEKNWQSPNRLIDRLNVWRPFSRHRMYQATTITARNKIDWLRDLAWATRLTTINQWGKFSCWPLIQLIEFGTQCETLIQPSSLDRVTAITNGSIDQSSTEAPAFHRTHQATQITDYQLNPCNFMLVLSPVSNWKNMPLHVFYDKKKQEKSVRAQAKPGNLHRKNTRVSLGPSQRIHKSKEGHGGSFTWERLFTTP